MRKLIKISALIMAFLSIFLVFVTLQAEQMNHPFGTNAEFELAIGDSPTSKNELIHGLQKISNQYDINIIKPSTSAKTNDSIRDIIFFSSHAPTSVSPVLAEKNRMIWLIPGLTGSLRSADEMGDRPLSGSYMYKSRPGVEEVLQNWAKENYLTLHLYSPTESTNISQWLGAFSNSGVYVAWFSAHLLLISLIFSWIISRYRAREIQLLSGIPIRSIQRDAFCSLIKWIFPFETLGILLGLSYIFLRLGLQNLLLLLGPALLLCLLSTVFVIAIGMAFSFIVKPTYQRLQRREMPVKQFQVMNMGIRVFALVLAILVMPSFIGLSKQAFHNLSQSEFMKQFGDTVAVSIKDFSYLDSEEGEKEVRNAFEKLSEKNGMVLSLTLDSEITFSDEIRAGYDEIDLVNPAYLNLLRINEDEGSNGHISPISFESLPHPTRDFLQSQLEVFLNETSDFEETYQFFTYHGEGFISFGQNAAFGGEISSSKNPLIVLVNDPIHTTRISGLLIPALSSGNLLFTDSVKAKDVFESSKLYPSISSIDRISDASLAAAQGLKSSLFYYLFAVILILAAVVANAWENTAIWSITHRKRIFVLHTGGNTYPSIYAGLVKRDIIIAAIVLMVGFFISLYITSYGGVAEIGFSFLAIFLLYFLITIFSYRLNSQESFRQAVCRKG